MLESAAFEARISLVFSYLLSLSSSPSSSSTLPSNMHLLFLIIQAFFFTTAFGWTLSSWNLFKRATFSSCAVRVPSHRQPLMAFKQETKLTPITELMHQQTALSIVENRMRDGVGRPNMSLLSRFARGGYLILHGRQLSTGTRQQRGRRKYR